MSRPQASSSTSAASAASVANKASHYLCYFPAADHWHIYEADYYQHLTSKYPTDHHMRGWITSKEAGSSYLLTYCSLMHQKYGQQFLDVVFNGRSC